VCYTTRYPRGPCFAPELLCICLCVLRPEPATAVPEGAGVRPKPRNRSHALPWGWAYAGRPGGLEKKVVLREMDVERSFASDAIKNLICKSKPVRISMRDVAGKRTRRGAPRSRRTRRNTGRLVYYFPPHHKNCEALRQSRSEHPPGVFFARRSAAPLPRFFWGAANRRPN
jgi:hypothetical protein